MPDATTRGRILIIDDQETNRYVLHRLLMKAGFETQQADSGAMGLTAALSGPDLIILDVNLPDMMGFDVCRRLKAHPTTQAIPVLQMSATFTSDESKLQALEGGADAYLVQPVEPAVFIAQVKALLRLRRAESASHLSALQWQGTFDSLSDGLALSDTAGRLVRANATFMRMFDYAWHEIEGRLLGDLIAQQFGVSLREVVARAIGAATEIVSGSRWFRVRYDHISSDPDTAGGSVLILTDITDQKKLQETLKLSEQLAATGRLAHIIAHEINNPLEAMSNLLYLAEGSSRIDPEAREYIQQASSELIRISTITKQVLAYHRESSRPTLVPAGDLVEGVLALFQTVFVRSHISIDLACRCSDSILVHPGEIRQVFNNLLSNAVDAMGDSLRKLRIACISSTRYPEQVRGVRFVFSDSGSGIPDSALPRIFEAFYSTKGTKGSGIGLWLSSEVLGKHQGEMRIRTRIAGPYRGTLIDVFLPLP